MRTIKILITLFLLSSNIFDVLGQRTIRGRILDDNMDILPKARIYNEDTLLLGETDLEGYFEVIVSKENDKVIIGFIGYEWATISVPENCDYLEVILQPYALIHDKSSQKIDRLRKKEFDKLPDLHKRAVDKGLFTIGEPCYHRQFIPEKSQLDKIVRQLRTKRKQIKVAFHELAIGDTIHVPYSGTYRYDGTNRTTLHNFTSTVWGRKNFYCLIEGVVMDKSRRRRGYHVVYKVTSTQLCEYDSIVYEGKPLLVGDILRHNMKNTLVITE